MLRATIIMRHVIHHAAKKPPALYTPSQRQESGDRLMFFTAFLPLGLQLTSAPRPSELPGSAELIRVEAVEPKGEAELLGIRSWGS